MRSRTLYDLPLLSGLMVFLSIIAFLVNYFFYQFPGNDFFPADMLLLTFIILIINLGLVLVFGKNSRATRSGIEFFYFFIIMSVIALASNAIQLTPFPTIDKKILSLEKYFNINITAILRWTNEHPNLRNLLGFIYDSLPYQMSILPLFIISMGRFYLLKEYYFLLLFTALLGFSFYYFFPLNIHFFQYVNIYLNLNNLIIHHLHK